MATELAWKQIDVAQLGAQAVALWDAKRKADAAAKVEREAFEAHVQGLIGGKVPAGKKLVCGYRFGKFSVALADDEGKAKPKATPLTLAAALGL